LKQKKSIGKLILKIPVSKKEIMENADEQIQEAGETNVMDDAEQKPDAKKKKVFHIFWIFWCFL
jgi:hypothetical protein